MWWVSVLDPPIQWFVFNDVIGQLIVLKILVNPQSLMATHGPWSTTHVIHNNMWMKIFNVCSRRELYMSIRTPIDGGGYLANTANCSICAICAICACGLHLAGRKVVPFANSGCVRAGGKLFPRNRHSEVLLETCRNPYLRGAVSQSSVSYKTSNLANRLKATGNKSEAS